MTHCKCMMTMMARDLPLSLCSFYALAKSVPGRTNTLVLLPPVIAIGILTSNCRGGCMVHFFFENPRPRMRAYSPVEILLSILEHLQIYLVSASLC